MQLKAKRTEKIKARVKRSSDYKRVDIDEEKNKEPREIELKLLKQRDGQATGSVYFEYHSRFNHYEETLDKGKGSTSNRYGLNISETALKGTKGDNTFTIGNIGL